MTLYLFYFLSFLAIFFAVLVVLSKNPVHSVLYLVITFVTIGLHYLLMNAQFLAGVHIIVYAGAIMVLFMYVIMMLNLNHEDEPHKSTYLKIGATISSLMLLVILVASLKGVDMMAAQKASTVEMGTVKSLGQILFTEYLFPFEISSVLLLASMVGAVMLGKPEKDQNSI